MPDQLIKYADLVLMTVITNKGKGEKIAGMFQKQCSTFSVITIGRGTADKMILSYLGLGESEKDILFSVIPYSLSCIFLRKLNDEMNFSKPGNGVAFSVPLNGVSIAGANLTYDAKQKEGEKEMEQSNQYDLIIAVTNQGYSSEVMEVVKEAGATGGTVLHARGIGLREAEKFFGITIQPEKEMVFVLVKKQISKDVITAIAEQKGYHTDAKAFAFSMPVNGVVGLPTEISTMLKKKS